MGLDTDLILFDLAKTFDTIVHELVLIKLRCLGIDGLLLHWIEMFMTQRKMCVEVADLFS